MKRFALLAVWLLLLIPGCSGSAPASAGLPGLDGLVIVLDPGHGGIDHGAIGPSGVKEDMLNLQIAFLVRGRLEKMGAEVVMTRQSTELDYTGDADTMKRRDMENRARLIKAANPAAVISIHMNKNPNKKLYGPQTYFLKDSPEGKKLAQSIQGRLLDTLPSRKKFRIVEGDYFILHVSAAPTVIVECGFLSNAGDEKRLQDNDWQGRIADAICDGISGYFAAGR